MVLVLFAGLAAVPTVASACGARDTPQSTYSPPKARDYDLVVDGRWEYAGDTAVRIDVTRTVLGPHMNHLDLPDAALGKDMIIVTCGPGPFQFTRDFYPEGRSYAGRFYLYRAGAGTYRIDAFVERKNP